MHAIVGDGHQNRAGGIPCPNQVTADRACRSGWRGCPRRRNQHRSTELFLTEGHGLDKIRECCRPGAGPALSDEEGFDGGGGIRLQELGPAELVESRSEFTAFEPTGQLEEGVLDNLALDAVHQACCGRRRSRLATMSRWISLVPP